LSSPRTSGPPAIVEKSTSLRTTILVAWVAGLLVTSVMDVDLRTIGISQPLAVSFALGALGSLVVRSGNPPDLLSGQTVVLAGVTTLTAHVFICVLNPAAVFNASTPFAAAGLGVVIAKPVREPHHLIYVALACMFLRGLSFLVTTFSRGVL
jgi:hypothetical protein